jgi:hypothetical protein
LSGPEDKSLAEEGQAADTLRVSMRPYFSSHLMSSAARLAALAKQIEDQHSGAPRFDLEHRIYVLSSIITSVGFLEAMINELFQDAFDDYAPNDGAITPLSSNTRQLMKEYWRATDLGKRGEALDKYQALLAFAGQPSMDKGRLPYQDAKLTVQLRNAIVHFRPEELSADKPADMEKSLRPRRFAENRLMEGSDRFWWPDRCLGWGCADWSLRAVTALADHVVNAVGAHPNYVVHRATGWLGNVPGGAREAGNRRGPLQ